MAVSRGEILAFNQLKAAEVRISGFTLETQEHNEGVERRQRDVVALKRLDEEERLRRVGAAGGTWGSRSALTALREPLPLSPVVSASEARSQNSLVDRGTAASAGGGGVGRGGASASSPSVPHGKPESLHPLADVRSSLRRQSSALLPAGVVAGGGLAPGGLLPETSSATAMAGEGSLEAIHSSGSKRVLGPVHAPAAAGRSDGETLVDYLPNLPFAKGANMSLSKRDKPTGIVI